MHALALSLAACIPGELTLASDGGDDRGSDSATDSTGAVDGGGADDSTMGSEATTDDAGDSGPVPFACGDASCAAAEPCCFNGYAYQNPLQCAPSCGGPAVECLGSDNCVGGMPCCAVVTLGPQNAMCTAEALSSSCVTPGADGGTCNNDPVLPDPNCHGGRYRLCSSKSDCDSARPNCCRYPTRNFVLTLCATDGVKADAGLTCL